MIALTAATMSASTGPDVAIGDRAKGAARVVVGTVIDVQSNFDVNEFGDRLIVSNVLVRVDETMKGPQEPAVTVTVEGGSVGALTLNVSDMPMMTRGERAVLFLDDSKRGGHVLHRRDLGAVALDATDHAVGSQLTLDAIRDLVKASQGKE
jgi:hypothetical protein